MTLSPVEIFLKSDSPGSFEATMRSLNGDFFFEAQDIMDLGRAYFDRYPDSYNHRNNEEVLMGYAIARICITEKAVASLDREIQEIYRGMVSDVSRVNTGVKSWIAQEGFDQARAGYGALFKRIEDIKFIIDGLPQGMIKERFIGGLTLFYNIDYLVKMSFNKYSAK